MTLLRKFSAAIPRCRAEGIRNYAVYTKMKSNDGELRVGQEKGSLELAKHGVGFDEASKVFSDPRVIIREDRAVEG
jgi:hypothetical protein